MRAAIECCSLPKGVGIDRRRLGGGTAHQFRQHAERHDRRGTIAIAHALRGHSVGCHVGNAKVEHHANTLGLMRPLLGIGSGRIVCSGSA